MRLVPLDTLVESHPRTPKNVQSATDRQVHLSLATGVDFLEVLQTARTARIGDGDSAPLGELAHKLLVHTLLQSFHVGGVDEEFGAVGLEQRDGFCGGQGVSINAKNK